MKIEITINCDNSAFVDNTVEVELSNILKELSNRLLYDGVRSYDLFDSYGNVIGKMELKHEYNHNK